MFAKLRDNHFECSKWYERKEASCTLVFSTGREFRFKERQIFQKKLQQSLHNIFKAENRPL